MMAASDGIFSIRLVVADFYMEKPVPGLDPVYSEFRGKEIKKVPIVRVFGSNAQGQKTCMHIHGVFPYFYVPYDQKDFESVNQAIYQMAINLDKAINISLSQGSSGVQHVFKVQLVKGIPFYGYHRSDHHYLKIYMFNPRFVRRAANLLQNGAIMNKNFHPHEAHVPYVLQFTIDYNIYGMSFIHVPLEVIKFRLSDISEQIPFKNLQKSQILDHNVARKMSCSTLEIDIGSNFILNRFQLIAKTTTTHTNPGIESIWNDEKLRRQKMQQELEDDEEKLHSIPPLQLPSTQDRPDVYPAESEIFYRTALVSKLVGLEATLMESSQKSDQTINCTFQSNTTNATLNNSLNSINRNQKRVFNLTKILQNSVYPEECTQNENLVNASFVENHLSNHNAFEQSLQMDMSLAASSGKTNNSEDSIFLDNTIVDEELVLSLTQTQQQTHVPLDATLREEDLELLDILQQLDEDNNENRIDLDSSLAPLSQNSKNCPLSSDISQKETRESIVQPPAYNVDCDEENIDEDNIHDFSIALESLDDLILKLTQSQINTNDSIEQPSNCLNQIDGSDDLLKTPTKPSASPSTTNITPPRTPTTSRARRLSQISPSRSPRTPKSGHKYKPLPLIITNRSTGKKITSDLSADTTPSKTSVTERENDLPTVFLRKRVTMQELRRKRLSIEINTHEGPRDLPNNTNVNNRRSRAYKNLDKTHVTCNLTPRKTKEKLLKVYCVDEHDKNDILANPQKKKTNESTTKTPAEQQKSSIHTTDVNSTGGFAAHEADEEVMESDNESTLHLENTPNLRRLRRSFLSSRSTKRRKVEVNENNGLNSSKLEKNNLSLEPTNNEQTIGTSNPADKCTTNSSVFKKSKGLSKAKKFADPAKLNNLKSSSEEGGHISGTISETHSELEVAKYFSPTNKCFDTIATASEVSSATNLKQSLNNLNNELTKPIEINKKSENFKHVQHVKQVVRHSKRIETICKVVDAKECRSSKRSIQKPDSENGSEIRLEDKKLQIYKQTLHTRNVPKEMLSFTSNTSKESLNCDSLDVVNKEEIHNPQISGNLVKVYINPSSKSSSSDSTKDLKNNETQQNIKSVRVRLKKLKNKNLEVFELDSLEAPKENAKNHSPKVGYSYDQTSETTTVKKGNEILDKTGTNLYTDKFVIPNNTENLLKSLLKLHGTVRTEMRTKIASSDVTPVLPTCEYSSKLSPKDLFQEFPVIPHSSDDEINETPPYFDNNDSDPSRCYEKSVTLHSPLLFTQNSSPNMIIPNNLFQNSKTNSISDSKEPDIVSVSSSNGTNENASPPLHSSLVVTPLDLPPTREEVLKGCIKLKLPEYEFQQPYYSNPDDITKQKEIGFTILQIQGNKLNDLEEFKSILGSDIRGLAAWRRSHLLHLSGPEMLNKYRNTQRIREYFADHKAVSITPHINAPTRQEVKLWLKARDLLKNKGEYLDINDDTLKRLTEEDSPIKVRRQKVTMMLNNEDGESGEDCDNSLTMTPLTPATPLALGRLNKKESTIFTPVTTKFEKIRLQRVNCFRKTNNRRVLKRVSLNQKMKEAMEKEKPSSVAAYHSQENKIIPASDESILPNSQTSETSSVSSQSALTEMERSSFMHQIQQHCVAIGSSDNNSSLNNSFGFKVALENLQQAKADIEIFVPTRDDLFPNPQIDEIRCLFYAIENSIPNDHIDNDKKLPRTSCGYIMVHDSRDIVANEGSIHGIDRDIAVTIVQTEVEALEALLGLCSRWDPDIYAGYEIEMSSWGFVIERAKYLCLNIAPLLSRVPSQKTRDFVDEDREQFTDLDVEMKLCGRILLDVWRLMRSEIALTSYTFENVMYHIMHKRCPWHSYRTLTEWFSSPCSRWIVIEYYLERVRGTLSLLDQLDLIGRTSEMAKLIGIQFYEVLSRGSQFRVESMMLRIAKPKNLVPLSPSVQQRAHMRAPEYLPLILEPQSRFYADPLIVLDFQSLYPSMIIGYNYCFSTCLGRVEHLGHSNPFEFGASQLRVSPTMLRQLVDRDLITISPCGVVFVKSSVREGILPRMLTEILDTRQMVKQSMKIHKTSSALQRILHSRQLGLKLMANTTYGYTAANFSGRMPAVEVGDTVVAKGRETLERAIKMVEGNDKWNVKVVYGDTDSMFILVPGRNRKEAFRIGEEIAEAVTKQNPQPVKLKLEKVYQPCILQTKKRYVGYMYETPDQKEPVYEAKGIETVRRDGCPIVAKMLEKVLRMLFESADVSRVKQYVCRQFTKLISGRGNLQDLIFAKEFRGINGYKPNACVPALELTRKWIQTDPRRIPRRGERVPFIITNGPPGVPLIRLIRHPHEILDDEGLKINAIYYITKAIIPPLNRCLLLVGADVNDWFASLPRRTFMTRALSIANEVIACPNVKSKKSTISQFFSTTNCITDCGRHTKQGICMECNQNPSRSMVILQMKISKIERGYLSIQQICQSCCGRLGDVKCGSLECPVLYVLEVKRRDLQQIGHFRNILENQYI